MSRRPETCGRELVEPRRRPRWGRRPSGVALEADLAALRASGVRFVVLHERFLPAGVRDGLGQALRSAVGAPLARAGGKTAWDLGPVSEGPLPGRPERPLDRGSDGR